MDFLQFETIEDLRVLSQKKKDNYLIALVPKLDGESTEKVALLIKAGADANKVCWFSGYNVLMSAAAAGAVSNVALLIQADANLECTTDEHDTALSVAIGKYAFETASLLFNLMTEDQLKNEIRLNELRFDTFQQYNPDIVPFLKDFNKKKKKVFKSVEDVLLLRNHHNLKNVFLILPIELRHLIYFKYCAVTKKRLLEKYCLASENSNNKCNTIKPLIFSENLAQKKRVIEDENFYQSFSLLSVERSASEPRERKKIKKRGCIIT